MLMTFNLVVKLATIGTVLSLATSLHWHVHQLDVKNAFLHGDLSKTVNMHQPSGFKDSTHPDYRKYATKILERAHMVSCNPVGLMLILSPNWVLMMLYRSLAGALQYLTFTRSDISYVVQQVCLYMRDPQEPHFSALKRILSRTSAEAEYCDVANAVAESCWFRNLLRELHTSLSSATLVYCDNFNAFYLSSNPVQHQLTKHVAINIHFVRYLVDAGQLERSMSFRSNCGALLVLNQLRKFLKVIEMSPSSKNFWLRTRLQLCGIEKFPLDIGRAKTACTRKFHF
ncbi:ribonuclease H-like domain-containing protein [Tanacetum coccineum]